MLFFDFKWQVAGQVDIFQISFFYFQAYDYIKGQISNSTFLSYLEEFKNLTDTASTQTTLLQQASSNISTFISTIQSTTDKQQVYELQESLVYALNDLVFTYRCYYAKAKTYTVAKDRCASAVDTLENIYNQVLIDFEGNSDDCKTEVSNFSKL